MFDIPTGGGEGLEQVSLEFLLLDWDRVTKNEVVMKSRKTVVNFMVVVKIMTDLQELLTSK